MKALEYTQKDGFTDIDFPGEWPDGLEFKDWLPTAGFKPDALFDDGCEYTYGVSAYAATDDASHGYRFLVVASDANHGDDIFVRHRSDLLALRLVLSRLVMIGTSGNVERMFDMLESIRDSVSNR